MTKQELRSLVPVASYDRKFQKVYICSPLSAPSLPEVDSNTRVARMYMEQVSSKLGCRVYAPHAFLPYLLDDQDARERHIALTFAKMLLGLCEALVVCGERISEGMQAEIQIAGELGLPILYLEDI